MKKRVTVYIYIKDALTLWSPLHTGIIPDIVLVGLFLKNGKAISYG